MKITIKKKEIADGLSRLQGITGRKTNLSITSDILIKAVDSQITITANDMETAFYGTYQAEIEDDGILSVNSRKFYEIIKEYPDEDILINEVKDRWIEIGTGDSLYHMVASDYNDFPEVPLIENVEFIEIASKDLKKMVEVASIVGYSPDEKRIYVLGCLIDKIASEDEGVSDKLRIVSTDSKRLNSYEADFQGNPEFPDENIIVPKKGLSELNKFIDISNKKVKVGVKDNHFIFQNENEYVMIKLLEGEYPNYKAAINYNDMIPIEVDKSQFTTLMKRVSILTSEEYKSVIMHFKNDELIVTITNPEIGESKERINIPFSADEIKTGFNPRYFIESLNLFDDEKVYINIKDNKSRCVISGYNNDRLVCVIMAIYMYNEE
jgi:DNA polymerase III subunit beta